MLTRLLAPCALVVALLLAPVAHGRQQTRDTAGPAPPGTATITGVVTSDEANPQPMRRAVVTISGAELPIARSAITDDSGRFAIARLPAGGVTVAATKRGYLAGAYGATRPGRPGTPVLLSPGQTVDIAISLARGAVVTGTIRDERGEPLAGLRVFAINALRPVAPGPTDRDTGTLSDDRGVYRIHSLAPGEYLVVATPTVSVIGDVMRRSASETDAVLARLKDRASATVGARAPAASATPLPTDLATLASVFHPGTASMANATRIKLAPGDIREGLDFAMPVVPVTTIEGSVVSPDGTLPGSIEMSIIPEDTLRFFALASTNPQLVKAPGADGQFKYSSITPGPYMIRVRANRAPAPIAVGRGGAGGLVPQGRGASIGDPETMYALETFEVTGAPVMGLAVRLQRGSQFSGRLVFDGASQRAPSNLTTVRVTVSPAGSTGSSTVRGTVIGSTLAQARYADLRADGTFIVAGLAPGRYAVHVAVPPASGQTAPGWWLRSAVVVGRDVLDTALDVALGTDVADAVVTMTDRRTELSGSLQTTAGLPAPEHVVIVFPADPALRAAGSRRVKSTRPATDGQFRFADLPAGDYLLAALTDVEPNEWEEPAFLAEIAPSGVHVLLAEGEQKVQNLRIIAQRGRVFAEPTVHGQDSASALEDSPPRAEGAATVGHRGEAGRNAGPGRTNPLQREQTARVRPGRRHRS